MDDIQCYVHHGRALDYCVTGQRIWFKKHGLDFRVWLKEGYPASVLAKTGDALALRLIEQARKEAENGKQGR